MATRKPQDLPIVDLINHLSGYDPKKERRHLIVSNIKAFLLLLLIITFFTAYFFAVYFYADKQPSISMLLIILPLWISYILKKKNV